MLAHVSHVGDCAKDVLTCPIIVVNLTILGLKADIDPPVALFLWQDNFFKIDKLSGGFLKSGAVIFAAFRKVLIIISQIVISE